MMKGLLFFLLLTLGAFSGIVLLIPTVMLILVHSKRVIGWRRRYVSFISGIYFDYAAALIKLIGGTQLYVYSKSSEEALLNDRSALVICNHRSLVDWMFAGWYYALYFDMNADFRVILKESLRSVPIYGWAMQIMMYIFVSRKREEDIPYLRKILSYLVCTGHSPSLLLFPEGTDLNESNKKKSNAYALAKNLPILEYVLYPKLSGLLCILNMLKERRENQIQLLSSEKHGSTETVFLKDSDDVLNTNAVQVNQVDRNLLLEKNKEHKADCVRNIPEVTPSATFHESKDGYQKEKKETEKDVAKDIKVMKKKEVNDVVCDNSSSQLKIIERSAPKSHRATTALHDLTIAYKDYLPGKKTTHRSILYGEFPSEVHILVDRFPIEDVPTDKVILEQWLRDSFFRKEKLLQKFYEDQTEESLTENWPRKLVIKSNGKHPIMSVSVWIFVVFSCLYFYSWFRWFVVVMIITCIAVRTFNGFDSVELALHGDMVFRDALTSEAEKKEKKTN